MDKNEMRAYLMEKRGYTTDYLDEIETSTADTLLDMDKMVKALHKCYVNQSLITILPDFDMDGIASQTLGFAGLSELGFNVALYEPHPEEGYGFTPDTIDDLVKHYPRTKTILTCDTGITCYEGVAYAKSLGIDVLVTDHHLQKDRDKLEADVIVDPNRIDDMYETPYICGAYTLWKCLYAYANEYCGIDKIYNIELLRVFASLGTVSDMMPVLYENRKLLRDGLSFCNALYEPGKTIDMLYSTPDYSLLKVIHGCDTFVSAFYGLYNLFQALYETGKIQDTIEEDTFGFYIAPMFNTLKRLNQPISIAYDVFFNPAKSNFAISQLMDLNEKRKQLVQKFYAEMNEQLQPYAPYIYISQAPGGILGLLATKKIEETGLPTFVVSQDGNVYHGSGRSPEWYPCNTKLTREGFHIAGHEGAFGIGFEDRSELESCLAFLQKDVMDTLDTIEIQEEEPEVIFGTEEFPLTIRTLRDMNKAIRSFRPFGKGFTEFTQQCRFKMEDVDSIQYLGQDGETTKVITKSGACILIWRSGTLIQELLEKGVETFVVNGKLKWNCFNDIWTLQFIGDLDEMGCK